MYIVQILYILFCLLPKKEVSIYLLSLLPNQLAIVINNKSNFIRESLSLFMVQI